MPKGGTIELANGRYFQLHRHDGKPDAAIRDAYAGPLLIIPRMGTVKLGSEKLVPGKCGVAGSIAEIEFNPTGQCLLARPK